MTFKYLVKPAHFRATPLRLKHALQAKKLVSIPGRFQPRLDFSRDFFLAYPEATTYPGGVVNLCPSYHKISAFYHASKAQQRTTLREAGIKTPEDYASILYIVRPLRHYGGTGYRITEDPTDYNPSTQYIAPAFPKWREYRVIFVMGIPLVVLRKKPPEGASPYEAWNHTNGSLFQTINLVSDSPLSYSNFFTDAETVFLLKDTHLIAVDVLLDIHRNYAVTELNFAPSITIEANLTRISQHANSSNRSVHL